MKIRVSKDYSWKNAVYISDMNYARMRVEKTYFDDYTPTFESVEVSSFEEIEEYVSKGYAIKINC